MNEYHEEILRAAREARIREVTEYEVNIRNFRRAIAKIGGDHELQPFRAQLEELLSSSLLEQRKARVMLEVVDEQLDERGRE